MISQKRDIQIQVKVAHEVRHVHISVRAWCQLNQYLWNSTGCLYSIVDAQISHIVMNEVRGAEDKTWRR